MQKIFHIIISVICLLCLIEMIRFAYDTIAEAETLTMYHYIMQPLAVIGWIYICWAELQHKRVTLWIIKLLRKIKK